MSDKFFLSNSARSSERLALITLQDIIKVLRQISQKLDDDAGVADTDYEALVQTIKEIENELGVNPKNAK